MANRNGASSRASSDGEGHFFMRSLGPEDRFTSAMLLAFAFGICVYFCFSQRLFVDGDTGWHLGAGRFILATHSIPRLDPFSFTFEGRAWHAQEWLSEALMAAVYNLAGWRGLTLLFSIAGGLTVFLCGRELARWLSVRWAICAMFIVCGLLNPPALARPHMLAWPLLAAWVLILVHARRGRRAPNPAALLIMLVWANLHASYMLGLGVAGVLTVEALWAHRRERALIIRWSAFLFGAGLASCITPHGIDAFLYPFEVSGMSALSVISEWRGSTFKDDKLFVAVAVAVWLLVALRWRRINPLRIGLLAGLTAMAVAHARHQMLFAIITPLMIGPLFSADQTKIKRSETFSQEWIATAALIMTMLLIAIRALVPFSLQDNVAFPLSAMKKVPPSLRSRPMFNGYSFGGPLILNGIRPYIDGRADMYGDAFTLDYVAMLRGDIVRFRRADQHWGFRWTILPPNAALVRKLDREPGWHRMYTDRWAIVHIRDVALKSRL